MLPVQCSQVKRGRSSSQVAPTLSATLSDGVVWWVSFTRETGIGKYWKGYEIGTIYEGSPNIQRQT
ncbi:hypothetical protein Pst134EA_027805 [Puccinia striiformis f. sp. tritici]|uniref:hypothetical protein n=1 Tax=Puccinia striiformis f. sp. tritici TaxID=168172 RepID=UPI0020079142|nr:hypothetical protein Pst134EA_027805 [Puccinia striiformis f. sp. tritici]KAH9448494.1 hypothetical protein Pst134EA_027805 [Puccinia striiformis f. sp. tritici]